MNDNSEWCLSTVKEKENPNGWNSEDPFDDSTVLVLEEGEFVEDTRPVVPGASNCKPLSATQTRISFDPRVPKGSLYHSRENNEYSLFSVDAITSLLTELHSNHSAGMKYVFLHEFQDWSTSGNRLTEIVHNYEGNQPVRFVSDDKTASILDRLQLPYILKGSYDGKANHYYSKLELDISQSHRIFSQMTKDPASEQIWWKSLTAQIHWFRKPTHEGYVSEVYVEPPSEQQHLEYLKKIQQQYHIFHPNSTVTFFKKGEQSTISESSFKEEINFEELPKPRQTIQKKDTVSSYLAKCKRNKRFALTGMAAFLIGLGYHLSQEVDFNQRRDAVSPDYNYKPQPEETKTDEKSVSRMPSWRIKSPTADKAEDEEVEVVTQPQVEYKSSDQRFQERIQNAKQQLAQGKLEDALISYKRAERTGELITSISRNNPSFEELKDDLAAALIKQAYTVAKQNQKVLDKKVVAEFERLHDEVIKLDSERASQEMMYLQGISQFFKKNETEKHLSFARYFAHATTTSEKGILGIAKKTAAENAAEAVKHFTKVLEGELTPELRADVCYNRGKMHYLQNKCGAALSDFNLALRLEPDYLYDKPDIRTLISTIEHKKGLYQILCNARAAVKKQNFEHASREYEKFITEVKDQKINKEAAVVFVKTVEQWVGSTPHDVVYAKTLLQKAKQLDSTMSTKTATLERALACFERDVTICNTEESRDEIIRKISWIEYDLKHLTEGTEDHRRKKQMLMKEIAQNKTVVNTLNSLYQTQISEYKEQLKQPDAHPIRQRAARVMMSLFGHANITNQQQRVLTDVFELIKQPIVQERYDLANYLLQAAKPYVGKKIQQEYSAFIQRVQTCASNKEEGRQQKARSELWESIKQPIIHEKYELAQHMLETAKPYLETNKWHYYAGWVDLKLSTTCRDHQLKQGYLQSARVHLTSACGYSNANVLLSKIKVKKVNTKQEMCSTPDRTSY